MEGYILLGLGLVLLVGSNTNKRLFRPDEPNTDPLDLSRGFTSGFIYTGSLTYDATPRSVSLWVYSIS